MGQPPADEVDTIWLNARLTTLAPERPGLGIVEKGAVASRGGRIAFAGAQDDLPGTVRDRAQKIVDCEGRWITPGLIDCHTHLVYGGDRAEEFEKRLAGATYEEIARAGGGILSTVRATRAATEEGLIEFGAETPRRVDRRRRHDDRGQVRLRPRHVRRAQVAARGGAPRRALAGRLAITTRRPLHHASRGPPPPLRGGG